MAASVLIVEDEELVAFTLSQILADEGYQVEEALSASAALAKIERQRFDVALLDLQIGDDSGLTVLAELKRASPGTVALILTGYGSLETAIQAMRQGAFDYLLKPCDVQELKAAIARGLEQRFRSIVQNAADIVMIVDASGEIRYVNPSIERILGYRPDELVGSAAASIMLAEDLQVGAGALLERLAAAGRQTPVQPLRVDARCRDGSRRTLELVASDLRDDRSIGGVVINARDISERRRAEQTLHLLAEASRVLAGSLDYQTTLASVVRLAVPDLADWCTVHTVEEGELRRTALAHRDRVTEVRLGELRERFPLDREGSHPVARVLRTGEAEFYPVVPEELLLAIAQSAEHLQMLKGLGLESYIAAPLQARGRTLGVMTFVSARARRQYGANDLDLAEEIARRAALAVDNARLFREVQQGIRARDDFLSSVAHDLRTPLTSIKGFSQMLLRRLARTRTPADAGILDALNQVDASVTRMSGLISMMLDLARLQMGQPLDLERKPVDLAGLARWLAKEKTTERHSIAVEAEPAELVGSWDAPRLERAIGDLLVNAIRYTPGGGPIRIRVWREQEAGRAWAALAISDEGLGIPAADLPQIFDRFYRGANVAGRIEGAGIGLTDARQIVEQHGGTLAVVSAEGRGATATLRLPLE